MEDFRSGIFYETEFARRQSYRIDDREKRPDFSEVSAKAPDRQWLPHIEVSADVSVVGTLSRTVLTQIFTNDTGTLIQHSSYCFPLYNGSVVSSFTCWLAGECIRSVVKHKDEARHQFREATQNGIAASLLEEHTSEVFETALGNIPSRTEAKVEIAYVTELKPDLSGDGVLVTIPSSIAPRYGSPPDSCGDTFTLPDRAGVARGMKINVNVVAPVPIRALHCRTHPISVEMGSAEDSNAAHFFEEQPVASFDNKRARATLLNRTAVLNTDFVLFISVAPSTEIGVPNLLAPRAIMESCDKIPDYNAVRVTFAPKDLFVSQTSATGCNSEILLLIDRSGSMDTKIDALKRALHLIIGKLPLDSSFNICSFGSSLETLWPQSRMSTPAAVQEARQKLQNFEANLGGTEILNALQQVVSSRHGANTQIFMLTDGEVWDAESVIDYVRTIKKLEKTHIRFFALGIGDQVSHQMIEGIGKHGGGFAEVVTVESSDNWDEQVTRMMNGLFTRSDWELSVYLKRQDESLRAPLGYSVRKQGPPAYVREVLRSPHKLPSYHGFSQSAIYFLLPISAQEYSSVVVEDIFSPNIRREISIERVKVSEPMIQLFAAKAILHDLETNQSWMHHIDINRDEALGQPTSSRVYQQQYSVHRRASEQDEIILEAQHIGKKWGIIGKWTSFVGTSSSKVNGYPSRVYQREVVELSRPRTSADSSITRRNNKRRRLAGPIHPGPGRRLRPVTKPLERARPSLHTIQPTMDDSSPDYNSYVSQNTAFDVQLHEVMDNWDGFESPQNYASYGHSAGYGGRANTTKSPEQAREETPIIQFARPRKPNPDPIVAYQDSRTQAFQQHYGPSEARAGGTKDISNASHASLLQKAPSHSSSFGSYSTCNVRANSYDSESSSVEMYDQMAQDNSYKHHPPNLVRHNQHRFGPRASNQDRIAQNSDEQSIREAYAPSPLSFFPTPGVSPGQISPYLEVPRAVPESKQDEHTNCSMPSVPGTAPGYYISHGRSLQKPQNGIQYQGNLVESRRTVNSIHLTPTVNRDSLKVSFPRRQQKNLFLMIPRPDTHPGAYFKQLQPNPSVFPQSEQPTEPGPSWYYRTLLSKIPQNVKDEMMSKLLARLTQLSHIKIAYENREHICRLIVCALFLKKCYCWSDEVCNAIELVNEWLEHFLPPEADSKSLVKFLEGATENWTPDTNNPFLEIESEGAALLRIDIPT